MCFEGAWDDAWRSMCEGEGGEVVEACPDDEFGVCDYPAHNGMNVLVLFYPPVTGEDAREMCRISRGAYSPT